MPQKNVFETIEELVGCFFSDSDELEAALIDFFAVEYVNLFEHKHDSLFILLSPENDDSQWFIRGEYDSNREGFVITEVL